MIFHELSPRWTPISTPLLSFRDAADGVAVVGARSEAVRHGWRVLAILSALMGFASIFTDLYLPAMPAMGRALRAAVLQLWNRRQLGAISV